jgi:hypothetical protein
VTARAWSLFLAVSALSGSAYLFIKVAVEALPALVVVEGRLAVGRGGARADRPPPTGAAEPPRQAPVPDGARRPRVRRPLPARHRRLGVHPVILDRRSDGGRPIFVAALAWWFDAAERVRGRRLVGLAVGMAGVIFLLGFEVSARPTALLGATLVLGASLSFAGGAL